MLSTGISTLPGFSSSSVVAVVVVAEVVVVERSLLEPFNDLFDAGFQLPDVAAPGAAAGEEADDDEDFDSPFNILG